MILIGLIFTDVRERVRSDTDGAVRHITQHKHALQSGQISVISVISVLFPIDSIFWGVNYKHVEVVFRP